jgi:hypothetical protein
MKFSRSFMAIWWAILLITIGIYLRGRYNLLVSGDANYTDVVVFLVWVAICLGPLFNEIELPGIKLSREIKELKESVGEQIQSIRMEVFSQTSSQSAASNNVWFTNPPSDSSLSLSKEEILKVVKEEMAAYGKAPPASTVAFDVSEDVVLLFKARHNIEQELRKLSYPLEEDAIQRRAMPISRMLWHLTRSEVITSDLAGAIREIYSVCSPAIHGEAVSEAQVDFVRDTAPNVVAALKSISARSA